MKIIQTLNDLKEKLKINDQPYYFKNVIDNPSQIVNWLDLEECINNNFYTEIIDSNSHKVNIPFRNTFWEDKVFDKKFIFDHINQGFGAVLGGYQKHKSKNLLEYFEHMFLGTQGDFHVYFGLDGSSSFEIHHDIPSNFIIQIEGETEWVVYKNRISPLVTENLSYDFDNLLEEYINVTLTPGDMLYIPSYCWHQAKPNGKRISLSISLQQCGEQPLDREYYKINYDEKTEE